MSDEWRACTRDEDSEDASAMRFLPVADRRALRAARVPSLPCMDLCSTCRFRKRSAKVGSVASMIEVFWLVEATA